MLPPSLAMTGQAHLPSGAVRGTFKIGKTWALPVEWAEANSTRYDLVSRDLQMPKMGGLEAARRIRTLPLKDLGKLLIIARTAKVFKEDVEHCHAAGMNEHLGKPLKINDALTVIKRYLL